MSLLITRFVPFFQLHKSFFSLTKLSTHISLAVLFTGLMQMKFDDIYEFFQAPPPTYLNKEVAACYVLAILLEGESYGTELIERLEKEYPTYRLSDTVLYSALKFLEDTGAIAGYWKKVEGRGRPRRMYRLQPDWQAKAQELADFWMRYRATNTQVV